MSALAEGERVAGRYRIEAPIGSGGMGVVYRATQLPVDRAVALKLLRPGLYDAPTARARFEREARVATALDHPSAVTVYDFGEDDGRLFMAMELVEGPSLREVVRAVPSVARAIELTYQLADALFAAHRVGLTHRDLKPENVIVQRAEDGADRVRVLDFGLAFLPEGPAGRMTREGVVVGTPEYLSPEQARGGEVGPATDIYALGCVLHELIAGQAPFVGADIDVLTKQMYAPPPEWRSRAGAVPAALDELRRAMLDKSAARRPEAGEVRSRLSGMDADPMRSRARAAHDGYLGPRAGRMVDAAPAADPNPVELEVGIVGEASGALMLGLRANGMHAFVLAPDEVAVGVADVVYAPGADLDRVAALRGTGVPVVVDTPKGDMKRLAALMRAGAADVVLRPVSPAALARKLGRLKK
ncbi:MAG: serine/threonine-protein kinase [Sandaracinaceae bacterium]